MSRFEVLHPSKGLAFGIDHVFGLFIQIWDKPTGSRVGPDIDNILVDMNDVTLEEITKVIEEHGFTFREMEIAEQENINGNS